MKDNKIHIAIVAPWFPPRTGVAVSRIIALSKYLKTDITDISVFSIIDYGENAEEKLDYCDVYRLRNNGVIKFFPTKTNDPKWLHYSKVAWNIFLRFIIKDEYKYWQANTINKLEEINGIRPFDVIISSFFPAASHVAVYQFIKNKPAVLWVADMRDEMSFNPLNSPFISNYYSKVEKLINLRANIVTTVSKPILEKFKYILNNVDDFIEIRNGFDHNETPEPLFNPVFTIVYAGTFYGKIKPDSFFAAMKELLDDGKLDFEWKIKFIGASKNFSIPNNFIERIEFLPYIENSLVISELKNADALLFINPSNQRQGVFTGKLFDYISVAKPIIPITVFDDVAADLIIEYDVGVPADFYDIGGIKKSILFAMQLWKNKISLHIPDEKLQLLHRKVQVKKLYNAIMEKIDK